MPPKISVLVPAFNGEAYLAECLDSVLSQDFPDYELLIGEDCSTDGTLAIIEHYAARDSRIRWWRNPRNMGLGGNLKACQQQARGEYIQFVQADDKLMAPQALRRMAAALDTYPSAVMVASATQIFDGQSRLLEVRNVFRHTKLLPGRKVIIQCLEERRNPIGEPSTVMFRRQLAERCFRPDLNLLVDLEMWLHLLDRGDFAYIAEPLCGFRVHAEQYSTAGLKTTQCHQLEYPQLLVACLAKPWFRQEFSKAALFANIYEIQKWKNPASQASLGEILKHFPRHFYYLYYVNFKLKRQLNKLGKHLRAYGRKLTTSR